MLINCSMLTEGSTCIISILRLQSLYVVSVSDDITWDNPLAAIWSSTETNVGIICSCLPTLKGCVAHFFPRFFPSTNSRSRSARDSRATGQSQPVWQDTGLNTKPIELAGRDKPKIKSHVETWEDEDSLREAEKDQSQDVVDKQRVHTNVSWLQDASSKEDIESRASGSDSVQHHGKPMSAFHAV